ncbi:MAG: hypothetical protein O2931_14710, partial [Planctomycetota bacterium]|nr:hypothetical protein [Planctomycetota bacterium]
MRIGVSDQVLHSTATVTLIWLLFLGMASGLAPDSNEAHYLCKARHYWQPEWCRDDFFLNSADAHAFFYAAFGWTTLWLPLPWVAYLGRGLTCLHLAWTWHRLSYCLVPRHAIAILTAALAMSGVFWCNLSGEWVLGGLEAKSFAFPWILTGLATIAAGNWQHTWPSLGVAIAWHPVVGGWAWITAFFAWTCSQGTGSSWRTNRVWMVLGCLLATPGLFSVIGLTTNTLPETRRMAAEIYVHFRLPHHLIPTEFGTVAWLRFSVLALLWGICWKYGPRTEALLRIHRVVGGSLCLGFIGCIVYAITRHDNGLSASWMRYYWFRWADVAVPCGVSLTAVAWLFETRSAVNLTRALRVIVVGMAVAATLAVYVNRWSWIPSADLQGLSNLFQDQPWQLAAYAQWKEACEWIRKNTPPQALFLTPRCQQTFHWLGERAEIVNRKNIPQDAAGIL